MNVEQCETYYFDYSRQHASDVPDHISDEKKQKRALECLILRDVIYSQFGIRYEYSYAFNEFLSMDGPGDAGCDHHIIDVVGKRVILIQSKMSDFTDDAWNMGYTMNQGELAAIEDFVDSIQSQTAKNYVSQVGAIASGSNVEQALFDRIDDIYNAINNEGYDVCIVQLCSGTFAGHWEATQLPSIKSKGWHGFAIGRDEIAHHATEAQALDSTGGLPDPIKLNFITSHSSTDDAEIIHGYITGSSLREAVRQEGWKLTRQNLRHFKGTNATEANSGMVETLNNEPERFHLYNNGLRITCSSLTKTADKTEQDSDANDFDVEEWEIVNAQIVNGGQTSFSIRKYSGATNLADVKVGCLVICETDEVVLRNIARYSNTQEALDAWDFHADSAELLRLKMEIELVVFEVDGNEKRFYFDQKSGAFEFLEDAQKFNHRIPRTAGKAIYYRISPHDFAKSSIIMREQPSIAKSKAKTFHATNATGKYNEVFLDDPYPAKPVLYTHIIQHQCKAALKQKVDDGSPKFLNQAIAHLSSLFHSYIREINNNDDNEWKNTIERYFDALEWHDGTQGKKVNEIRCEYFTRWFDQIIPTWSGYMAGAHSTELETANSYFNGPDSYTHCTTWQENWVTSMKATPGTGGKNMYEIIKEGFVLDED
tara:strand:+ start:153 stop:2111 length:1959 start_codon:yes stop_codon:yes gene_type:complete